MTDQPTNQQLDDKAEIAKLRGLLAKENARANAAIDREETAEQAALEAQEERDKLIRWHREDETALAEMRATIDRLRAELAASRSAALTEGATAIDHLRATMLAPPVADRYASGLSGAAGELRRMAASGAPGAEDTLPAWLYSRFNESLDAPAWDRLDDGDRAYWAHQAAAVRRAVARGGFKNPAPAAVPAVETGR